MSTYEPTSAADLRAHYRAVRKRIISAPAHPRPPIKCLPPATIGGCPSSAQGHGASLPPPAVAIAALAAPAALAAAAAPPLDPYNLFGRRVLNIETILRATSLVTGINRAALLSTRHTADLCFVRHCAMYLARELTAASLPKIGLHFGNRDHTTILHGARKVAAELAAGHPERTAMVNAIRHKVDELLIPPAAVEAPIWS
jgi:Bacterial dnaA protein helix-turn-helix